MSSTSQPPKDILPISSRTISLPAYFESLEKVRQFVSQAAESCGLKPEAIYAVQLAVDEAFTNIIEHAYGGECEEEIQCTCQTSQEGLTIILQDCGHPFDPTKVPEPDLEATLEERRSGGLGLYFIRRLMDEATFTFRPAAKDEQGCNTLTMFKRKEKVA